MTRRQINNEQKHTKKRSIIGRMTVTKSKKSYIRYINSIF